MGSRHIDTSKRSLPFMFGRFCMVCEDADWDMGADDGGVSSSSGGSELGMLAVGLSDWRRKGSKRPGGGDDSGEVVCRARRSRMGGRAEAPGCGGGSASAT